MNVGFLLSMVMQGGRDCIDVLVKSTTLVCLAHEKSKIHSGTEEVCSDVADFFFARVANRGLSRVIFGSRITIRARIADSDEFNIRESFLKNYGLSTFCTYIGV